MIKLDLPQDRTTDWGTIEEICKATEWKPHRDVWRDSYDAYHDRSGDPNILTPSPFPVEIKTEQRALYDKRRSRPPLSDIRSMAVPSCPMCGSLGTGTLDHYLPRKEFPEFAIMSANLVPACSYCNSFAKRTTYKGSNGERFAHPYFDSWLNQPVWQVRVYAIAVGAIYSPEPQSGLPSEQERIVRFHLGNVLEDEFHRFCAREWAGIQRYCVAASLTDDNEIESELEVRYRRHEITNGCNSWYCALLRGILSNPDTRAALREQVGVVSMNGLALT